MKEFERSNMHLHPCWCESLTLYQFSQQGNLQTYKPKQGKIIHLANEYIIYNLEGQAGSRKVRRLRRMQRRWR